MSLSRSRVVQVGAAKSPLQIQIASDLHLEFYGPPRTIPDNVIVPRAPVLALLGDIGCAFTNSLRFFLHQQADRFQHVVVLAGNHEFYNNKDDTPHTVPEQLKWLQDVCNERHNLHFLERESIEINGVLILGTILWSWIPPPTKSLAECSMNDYWLSYTARCSQETDTGDGQGERMTATYTNTWFKMSVKWLDEQLKQATDRHQSVLVLTHHTPSVRGTCHSRYDKSDLNCCFSSDLEHLFRYPLKAWACGHTHYNFDLQINGIPLVSNQRGYPGKESANYDKEGLLLEISSNVGPCPSVGTLSTIRYQKQTIVRLVVISDTHGHHGLLPSPLPKGNVLIHCGDVADRGSLQQIREFVHWFSQQECCPEKIVISGNHDRDLKHPNRICLKQEFAEANHPSVHLLMDETKSFSNDRIRIHGCSWETCENDDYTKLQHARPLDVVLSHRHPHISKKIAEPQVGPAFKGWRGSRTLTATIVQEQVPLCLSGHVHYSRGVIEYQQQENTHMFVNCSSLFPSRMGLGVSPPVVIDYDPMKRRVVAVDCPLYDGVRDMDCS